MSTVSSIDVFDLGTALGRLNAFIVLARATRKEQPQIEDGLGRMVRLLETDFAFYAAVIRKCGIQVNEVPTTAGSVEALFNRVDRALRSGDLNLERAWRLATDLAFLLWYRP